MQSAEESIDLSALRIDPAVRRNPSRRRRFRFWWVPLGLVVVLAVVAVVLPFPMLLPQVPTTAAQKITAAQGLTLLTATGYTYARERAAVGARIVGRVVELGVEEGDRVEVGQLIARLDDVDLRANVREAQARVEQAKANLADATREEARQRALLARAVSAQAAYDAATTRLDVTRAELAVADAALASARAQAEYAVIQSPIPGIVIERNVEVGEMVAPGGFTSQQSTGAIVRIANLESLEVEADVSESYIAKVVIGQPVLVRVDAVPDRTYHGKLRQVVPTADRQRGTVQVKVTVDDRDERLVPDMSCAVSFLQPGTTPDQLAGTPEVRIPKSAVVVADGKSAVYQVTQGRLVRTPVTLGREDGDQIIVTSGLKGGETIATQPDAGWKDGKKIREKSA